MRLHLRDELCREIQGDTGRYREIQGDTGEIQGRYRGDTGELFVPVDMAAEHRAWRARVRVRAG